MKYINKSKKYLITILLTIFAFMPIFFNYFLYRAGIGAPFLSLGIIALDIILTALLVEKFYFVIINGIIVTISSACGCSISLYLYAQRIEGITNIFDGGHGIHYQIYIIAVGVTIVFSVLLTIIFTFISALKDKK